MTSPQPCLTCDGRTRHGNRICASCRRAGETSWADAVHDELDQAHDPDD